MEASSYRLLDATNSNTIEDFLQHGRRPIKKKLRSGGGFQAAFPLYHMNRHKQQTPEKPKQKANLKQEKPMQTKQSVTNPKNHQPSTACREKRAAMKLAIRSTLIAAFGLLSALFLVHQHADAQGIRPRAEAAQ